MKAKTPLSMSVSRVTLVLVVLAMTVASFSMGQWSPAQAAAPNPNRTAFVNLFEWKWTDVARECETYLGPKGFAAVQVSPPQEHVVLPSQGYPWWQNYQPVSYQINSRMGNRSDFQNMVTRCNAVGVKIYADVVINHMADGNGTGFAGSTYTDVNHWYTYPGIYGGQDFHWNVSGSHNCQGAVNNYQNQHSVQDCELAGSTSEPDGLPDLATETTWVRSRIADYLKDLWDLGVRGFRIDAVKHIAPDDVNAILQSFQTKAGITRADYYVVQEIIDPYGSEAVKKEWYYPYGDVNDFRYGRELKAQFMNWDGKHISYLSTFGQSWGLAQADKAVPFIDNHDMQRGERANYLTNSDNSNHFVYTLANVFMLAWPFGYPQIMSSYSFSDNNQGPPTNGNGTTKSIYDSPTDTTPDCFTSTGWVCEHRWREIGNMVAFRNSAGSTAVTNWWDNGNNQIAFGRGDKGFVVINREDGTLNRTFQTGLAAGTYCDIIAGDWDGSTCSGRTLVVNASGQTTISVPGNYAAAIHVGAKLSSGPTPTPTITVTPTRTPTPTATPTGPCQASVTFKETATTWYGQNVYVVGNVPELGGWDTNKAVALSANAYPLWQTLNPISITANTAVQYKYIKKPGDNGNAVTWESDPNRSFTTPGCGGTTTRTDTWR